MNFKNDAIINLCQGIYDGPHATPPMSDSGAIFLGISNITKDGYLDLTDIRYISDDDLEEWTKRVTPQEGDIVFSYEATLNLYGIIPKGFRGCLGRRMALIRPDNNKVLGKYLYYYFFSNKWREVIQKNTITGATVDRIPLIKFPNFNIEYPEIDVQRKFVSVLSAYDSLIENNQKQIELLEEAAQRLYKEWFEKKNLEITSKKHSFRKIKLGEIASFVRGKTITSSEVKEGNVPVVAGGLEPAYYHNIANTKAPVITVSGSGANAGFTNLYYEDIWASDCSFVDVESTKYPYYVFCFLKRNKAVLDNLQKGAAQPHVYAKDLNNIDLMLPDEIMLEKFEETVSPIFKKIKCSLAEIKHLKEARYRLLPKLMNGEIEL